MEPVTWINCFEMPKEEEETFFKTWLEKAVTHFSTKPGFINYKMYRSHTMPGRFAFVNITLWESVDHIRAAHDEAFRELLKDPTLTNVKSYPGIYALHAQS